MGLFVSRPGRCIWCVLAACACIQGAARAEESALVKLLKSGRVPEARQGAVVEMIGRRGTVDDLTYLFEQVISSEGFSPSVKAKALAALAEAAENRGLKPARDLDRLASFLKPGSAGAEPALQRTAIRLAGVWKMEAAADALAATAQSTQADDAVRSSALEALAEIGGQAGRSRIEALAADKEAVDTRILAVAALARLDANAAASRAAAILALAPEPTHDLKPILAAFLNRQGGGDILAAAISRQALPADAAKLALRAVYALGRSDQALVSALSRAAGISAETKPLTPAELSQLVAEVAAKGNPARGELIFRRADLNCISCHAVSKAGGDVGPDLSAVGQTSPADYIINSILNPDQSIKEQFHTLIVLTTDGQIFQGIITDKDEQRIILKEATGATRTVPIATVEDQKAGGSLMPKGLASLMTHSEFVDLVRFLSELGKPGPFAIRPTPTLQRYRVLKSVPQALAEPAPTDSAVREQLRDAGPERWATVYAKVAGSMPLDELAALSRNRVVYLQGEINVSAAGEIKVLLDSAAGTRFWVDDAAAPDGAAELATKLSAGRHTITLRVDLKARPSHEINVELSKPPGSTAEFVVVGGR